MPSLLNCLEQLNNAFEAGKIRAVLPKQVERAIKKDYRTALDELQSSGGYSQRAQRMMEQEILDKHHGVVKEQLAAAVEAASPKPGSEPPLQPETPPPAQTEFAPRNAAIDANRVEQSLPEISPADRRGWEKPIAEASGKIKAEPDWPKLVAKEVAGKPRALTDTETMGLTLDLKRLTEERAAATKEVLGARESGDATAEARALLRQSDATDALTLNHTALRNGGNRAALSMSIRNAILKDDYSVGRNMDRAQVAYGKNFTPDLRKQVEVLSAKIEKMDQRLKEVQDRAQQRGGKKMTADERTQAKLQKKIDFFESKIEERSRVCIP